MSSIEGIEDPFGPGTAGGTALLKREETQLSEPVSRCARCAARCGFRVVIRRSSRCARSARRFTRAWHRVMRVITAPVNSTTQTIHLSKPE